MVIFYGKYANRVKPKTLETKDSAKTAKSGAIPCLLVNQPSLLKNKEDDILHLKDARLLLYINVTKLGTAAKKLWVYMNGVLFCLPENPSWSVRDMLLFVQIKEHGILHVTDGKTVLPLNCEVGERRIFFVVTKPDVITVYKDKELFFLPVKTTWTIQEYLFYYLELNEKAIHEVRHEFSFMKLDSQIENRRLFFVCTKPGGATGVH